MKNKVYLACLLMVASLASFAQPKPVKIVFDITSKDTLAHKAVLRHVSGMVTAYPQSQFEVVVYGSALPMLVSGKSVIEKGLISLAANKNLTFKACATTMARNNVDKSQLIIGVEVVPDAILELATKQAEGWGYIKE